MVSVFRRFFHFLELVHGQFCGPCLLLTHIKPKAVETSNDKMDNKRVNYNMAAFVTSEKFPGKWSWLTADVKTLFCHFVCQYSLFCDNFFFTFFQMKDYSQKFILTQNLHFQENGPSEGTL